VVCSEEGIKVWMKGGKEEIIVIHTYTLLTMEASSCTTARSIRVSFKAYENALIFIALIAYSHFPSPANESRPEER
jgi:hypothetical protein